MFFNSDDSVGGWKGLLSAKYRLEVVTGLIMGIVSMFFICIIIIFSKWTNEFYFLFITVALTGINAVIFYAPSIFELSGFGEYKVVLTMVTNSSLFCNFILKMTKYLRCLVWWSSYRLYLACLCCLVQAEGQS